MSKKSVRWILGSVALVGVLGQNLLADGFRNPPPGAVGLGRAGVIAAQVDDASAIFYNPANLIDLNSPEFELAASLSKSKTEYSRPGYSASTDNSWGVLPNVFFAYPLSDVVLNSKPVVLGLGLTTPFGQSSEWDKDSFLKYTSPYWAQMQLLNINPSAAIELAPGLSLGVGVDIYLSSLKFKQSFPWSQVLHAQAPDGNAVFSGDGAGLGGNAGLTWAITDKQRLAFTYRSQVTVDYSGDFTVDNMPPLPPVPPFNALSPGSDFDSSLRFPDMFSVGYGIEIAPGLKLESDVEYLRWSLNERQPIAIGNNAPLMNGATEIVNDWKDTWTAGVSAEWRVDKIWTVRAGYLYLPSPITDQTLLPVLADTDTQVLALGLGWRKGGHAVDVAYAFNCYQDRNVTDNHNPAVNGDYENSSQLVSLDYIYTF